MKTIQKSPLVHVWSLVATLIAAVGVVVTLAQPALASVENAYSVTISTVGEQPSVLYTNTIYTLGKTRISALKVLAKAGVVEPGKVHKLTANPKGAVTTVAPDTAAMDPNVSSDDLLFVVKRQAAKVALTITYGNAQTELKLRLACVPSQIAASDTITEDESNAPPAADENPTAAVESVPGEENVSGGQSPLVVQGDGTYAVNVTCEPSEAGNATADPTSGEKGDFVTLSATPITGYLFKEWQVPESVSLINDVTAADNGFNIGTESVEIKAIFGKEYKVTVDADGHGSAFASAYSGTEGTLITLDANPNTGYQFKEWEVVSGGITVDENNQFTIGTADVVVKAIFEKVHSVHASSDGNGTASATPDSGVEGAQIALTATPNAGYEFDKWQITSGTEASLDGDTLTIGTSDVTVEAQFKEIPVYKVTVDTDEHGTASAAPDSGPEGTEVALTAKPNAGYQLKEWQVIYGTGASVKDDILTIGTTDVVVKAVFEAVPTSTVTVTFDANGGTGTMDPITEKKDKENDGRKYAVVTLPACTFTRPGYTFTGWNTKKDGTGTSVADMKKTRVYSDVTLYAQWKEGSDDTVTITFEANGGKGTMDPITKKKEYDEGSGKVVAKVKLPDCAFTRSGHTFTGWNTKEDGSGQPLTVGKTYKFPKDYTLYAQWKEGSGDTVTINFDANEGKGTMDPITGKKGEAIKLPNCSFTRDGYHFTGWNTAADGSGQALNAGGSYKFPRDYTLYAQWAEGSGVTISFDANGGEGDMDSVLGQPGETITLPSNEFQYEGHYFANWNTAADGSGTPINNGARIKVPSRDVTLYAQWQTGSEIQTKNPVVATSAGGNYTSRTTDVAFAIGQEIPADATYARIWFDLHEAMSFTTAPSVRIQNGDVINNAKVSINGQHLEVVIDDPATIEGLRGKMVRIDFKARARDDVDLSEYEEDEDGVAYIPYQAFTEFRGAETRTVESEEKNLRIRFSDTSSTTSRTGGTTSSNGTTARTNSNTAAAKRNSSLAKTGDPTSMAAVVTAVLGGAGFVMAGLRRRK